MTQREYFSASLVTQGQHKFYTLTLPVDIIAECCSTNPRSDDPEAGFQRSLDEKRAASIAEYVRKGGVIPSSIILSAQAGSGIEYISKNKTVGFNIASSSFLIIDGQHRVYGFRMLSEMGFNEIKLRIPVVIFTELTPIQEAKIFIDVNTQQKPVPKELLLDIKKLAETETSEEALLDVIFTLFEQQSDSSLKNKLARFEKQRAKISKVTFYEAFKPLLKAFAINNPQRLYEIINAYLYAVKDLMQGLSVDFNSIVTKPTSFKILIGHSKAVITIISDNAPDNLALISEHKRYLLRSMDSNTEALLNSRTTAKSIEALDKKLLKRNLTI
ncbi:DGQHR domain-containing protein [Cronobacter turicensis]|uniref:DGQHR domain-containing protein n=1 Tax=Cronobacter dublinensis TaxID=413497 RepID=UPI00292DE057|nr:DGQHR domain-containing protein [Cronobacter dublinensis]WNY81917.1 DGQHR domain-containing protein [Cronobacter dublinensis]